MKIFLITFLITLCGCKTVEYFGILSTETFNEHVDEIQKFSKEAVTNQGELGSIITSLADENVIEAKADDDEPKLERSIKARVRAEVATKKSNQLADTQFTKAPDSYFDWESLFSNALKTIMGMVIGYFGVSIPMGKKVERMKQKIVHHANSTEKDDISNDKDLK